jgi:hypothetical protein
MWWTAKQIGYPDVEMCAGFINGFRIVGNLWPLTYIHRAKLTQATMDSEECHHANNMRMIGSIRRRGLRARGDALEDLTECYAKTVQEVEDGWMEGPFSFSDLSERFPEGFWVMQRNPHRRYPNAAVRPVDVGKRSVHNKCTTAHESIQCENADYGCRMAAIFRDKLGPTAMKIGTDDLKKAFRQIPCSQARYNIVAIWNPSKQRVEFFILNRRSSKNLMGHANTSLGYAAFVHGYQVPIRHVNHMKAGYAYAPMHDIQFAETSTEKYFTEQKF